MAGLRLAQAVQDSVESFLIEQGPLRHSGVTAGAPVHPPLSPSPTQPPLAPGPQPKAGTSPHAQGRGGVEAQKSPAPPGHCPQPWPGAKEAAQEDAELLPNTTLRPPSTPILTSSGEKWGGGGSIWGPRGKNKVLGGLDQGSGGRTAPPRAGPGLGPGAPAPSLQPTPHTCSPSRPPGGPIPGPPSLSPGLLWLRSISAQRLLQRELLVPWPQPPFLPQRKQHCLSGGHARHPSGGSEAQQRRWETGAHAKQARGPLS